MGYPGQQFTDTRPSPNDLIKDVQKTLSALGEDELTREDFEQTFVFLKASQILKPEVKLPKKPDNEEVKRESDAQNSDHSDEEAYDLMSSMKEYPKISKLLRNLIILMHQANIKSICNKDQLIVAVVGLTRNIAEILSGQQTVPYDFINQCLDIINKFCGPFRRFHHLSPRMFEQLVAICEIFFRLLESGGKEEGLASRNHYDLWFKIMMVL
jgi:hypothetical protein